MKPNLFVISPIGPEDSEIRRRSDQILEMFVDAVGDKYEVKRHDKDTDDVSINRGLQKSLDTSLMAVSYLGRPDWNANVMFETGYRIATRKPILLVSHEKDVLPFDIQDMRNVRLPEWSELDKFAPRKKKVEEIRLAVEKLRQPSIASSYPVVEIFIDLTPDLSVEEKQRNCVFTMSSEAADYLFHSEETLAGQSIYTACHSLEFLVEERQWGYFNEEQDKLLGRLLTGKCDITARIPWTFKKDEKVHADLRGCAYLAMIVQHRQQENSMLLRILYYRVPSTLRRAPSGDHHYCDLDSLLDLQDAIQDARTAEPHQNGALQGANGRAGRNPAPKLGGNNVRPNASAKAIGASPTANKKPAIGNRAAGPSGANGTRSPAAKKKVAANVRRRSAK